ncbi:FIG00642248: hypothetical protein [Cronobacter condimenti 1330]|uniref:Uncharacterized protein n=6 Tax=Enterobacteriaceae TaxID=543 RepID=K8A2K7_9ENTR|nr:FIG00642248: hypothetical protein [Cronobacter condimenti 1330]
MAYSNLLTIMNNIGAPMKLRKILKSMFENYCKTFKDVPPGGMF